jgi:hypothetical protein
VPQFLPDWTWRSPCDGITLTQHHRSRPARHSECCSHQPSLLQKQHAWGEEAQWEADVANKGDDGRARCHLTSHAHARQDRLEVQQARHKPVEAKGEARFESNSDYRGDLSQKEERVRRSLFSSEPCV